VPALDSTHPLRGFSSLEDSERGEVELPIGAPDSYALRHLVWREIDRRYRDEAERIVMIRANRSVKVEEEDMSPDFEPRTGVVDRKPPATFTVDRVAWEERLVELSKLLEVDPDVHWGFAQLQTSHVTTTFVDTEGTRLVHGINLARVSLSVSTTAPDGDQVHVFMSKDAHDPALLPTDAELRAWATEATRKLDALRKAPRGTPYSGPVILAGRATAVFFHEVFGHRVEGTRQKREDEGKTFAEYVGQPILPAFIDVVDDPTRERWGTTDLNGFYTWDDEGVAAAPAELVKDGKFVGFMMDRSPIEGFAHSNGHGRRSAGNAPVARMGNTIVTADQTVPKDKLRALLLEEVKKQGLAYGMLVEEIDGGFTLTGRVAPNSFNVRASTSWRIFADGRPDELVRGIDLVGTPLVAFSSIVAAGDDAEVFNGFCGAESGWVPVSGVAPTVMFKRLEFQLKEKGQERPPLLVKPGVPPTDGASDGGAQ
jgi:TldD protein